MVPGSCLLWAVLAYILGSLNGFEVGNMASDFMVQHGQAQYTLPIETPKGFPKHLLELALEYNSGSKNGPIGLGWSLKGLSEISR